MVDQGLHPDCLTSSSQALSCPIPLPTIFRHCSQHMETEKIHPYFKKLKERERHRHTTLTVRFSPGRAWESAAAKAWGCLRPILSGSPPQESWFLNFPQMNLRSSQRSEAESVINNSHDWGTYSELNGGALGERGWSLVDPFEKRRTKILPLRRGCFWSRCLADKWLSWEDSRSVLSS